MLALDMVLFIRLRVTVVWELRVEEKRAGCCHKCRMASRLPEDLSKVWRIA